LEQLVHQLPSIGETFADGQSPEAFMTAHFHGFSPKILGNRRVEFFCPCRHGQVMAKMPEENLKDLLNGPFPIETRCHNCNTIYHFDKEEIEKFLNQDFQD
jgi:molecular chaperone Hsp33